MFERIAVSQMNPTVGDISGNSEKILAHAKQAAALGAELVVFPELALIGYSAEDLVLSPAFQQEAMQAVSKLAEAAQSLPALLVGGIWREGNALYNACFLLSGGKIVHKQYKVMLPNYGVFDEKRVFTPGSLIQPVMIQNIPTGILICEDIWSFSTAQHMQANGAKRIIAINASPFDSGKQLRRQQMLQNTSKKISLPILYANMCGGQDDLVFDGQSFVCDATGAITFRMGAFTDAVSLVNNTITELLSPEENLWKAATLGLRDYVHKSHMNGVVIGLSGGIDSAVVATMAVDAFGSNNVLGVLLPSPYTSNDSIEDAALTAKLLGIKTLTLPITGTLESAEAVLYPALKELGLNNANWREEVAVGGNIQARLRAVMLMGLSNATGKMLLNTSNKSEIAMGFSTLYGDSCGGYAPLKDIYKTEVYAIARWRNAQNIVIPENSINKAPTAELKPGQKDEDHLPPYPVLDAILKLMVEERLPQGQIIAKGYEKDVVQKVARLLKLSEYKRRQSPPGPKVSTMHFTRDRRYPIVNASHEK